MYELNGFAIDAQRIMELEARNESLLAMTEEQFDMIEELEAKVKKLQYEIKDLTAAWKDSIDGVERIAFDIKPPNENTPRFITWVIQMRNKLNRIKARG